MFQGKCDLQVAVRKFEGSVFEFAGVAKGGLKILNAKVATLWKPLEHGRMAINVDASMRGGLSSWAMIARNHLSKLIFVASWSGGEIPPTLAKPKALAWAASLVRKNGWTDVEWRSDAQALIKQVLKKADPGGWDTRNEILLIHHFYREFKDWSFEWVPKSANAGADAVAKETRVHKCNLEISDNFTAFLPASVLRCFRMRERLLPLVCKLFAAVCLCLMKQIYSPKKKSMVKREFFSSHK